MRQGSGYLRGLAAGVEVTIDRKSSVKAGEPFSVAWRRGPDRFPLSRPVHLVFAMPDGARCTGGHILPIPPGARALSGIAFGANQLRVFLPLAQRAVPGSGGFTLAAHRTGPFAIASAVVAKTACGETVLAETGTTRIEIEPGTPRLLVQDFFSLEQPDRSVISADGRYRLDIFKASYRVYDVSTGVKIVDRAGRHPNFSPAARYVAAYALGSESAGGTMELIDLVTGAPIPDLAVTGPILAWALGDALLIEGTIGHPEIRIRRSLVNPTFRKPDAEPGQREEIGLIEMSTSGRGDSAWGRYRIKLLLDQSLALIEFYEPPATKTNFAGIYELAAGRIIGERGDLTPEARRAALASYGLDDAALANRWDLGEPLQLSHDSPQADAVFGEPAQNAKGSKAQAPRLPKQRSFLALHREKSPVALAQAAAPVETVVRGLDWRTRSAGERTAGLSGEDLGRFALQLARFGIGVRPGCQRASKRAVPTSFVVRSEFFEWTFQYGSQKTTFTKPPAQLERDLVEDVPLARKLLTGKPNNICYQDAYESDAPIEKRMKFRMIADAKGNSDVHGVWSWSLGSRNLWLVQAVCSHAGILNSPVILFDSGTGGSGSIYLLGGEAQEAAGLNKDFDPTPHEAVLRVRPSLLDDRWLLIAAPAGKSAAIIDLEAPAEPIILHQPQGHFCRRGAAPLKRRAAARAAQHGWSLLRLRTADGDQLISGRWIDDEMVLVTERGYYDGSYEGGHFIHVGFSGEDDIYSLAQFEKALKRPDIVKDVVAGKIEDGPELTLQVPPNIAMELAREGGALAARMQIRGGTGLKAVRLFDDGELVKEIALQGRTATPTASFEQPLKGRWLAAIAEDQNGLFSAPALIANPRRRLPSAT